MERRVFRRLRQSSQPSTTSTPPRKKRQICRPRRAAQAALLDDALQILQGVGERKVRDVKALIVKMARSHRRHWRFSLTDIAAQPLHSHPEVLADSFRRL